MFKSSQLVVGLVVAMILTARQSPAPAALVNYWALDENAGASSAIDSAGGKHASNQGAVTFGATGMFGNAAEFDGTTDSWLKADGYKGITGKTLRTVSTWVKADSDNSGIIGGARTAQEPGSSWWWSPAVRRASM